ncbi:hypothetical protein BV25DRAFT_1920595 [Artomyces pyxidatus]|uniref:Uncharacterized protein n=1 Tax=Artomyces pyxidatus TaxID=48021 RepID=A0ACB8SK98_9AGAM|nr:hypothetical protein BV25DRAFT_1920595 [Artomyces pyxidatus]
MQCNFNFLIALLLYILAQTVAAMPVPTDTLETAPTEATPTIDSALAAPLPEGDFVFAGGGLAKLAACMTTFEKSVAQFLLNF